MKNISALIFSSLILSGCSSCSNSNNPTGSSGQTNLLTNPSFEINGDSSLTGWSKNTSDTSHVKFSSDVPQGAGTHSIRIATVWGVLHVTQTIPAIEGTHQYKLSAWAKYSPRVGGALFLDIKHNDSLTFHKVVDISDTTWTHYTILDTITASQGDSLIVELRGGISQQWGGWTFFDLCELLKLDN